jgi:hypothetical protein
VTTVLDYRPNFMSSRDAARYVRYRRRGQVQLRNTINIRMYSTYCTAIPEIGVDRKGHRPSAKVGIN